MEVKKQAKNDKHNFIDQLTIEAENAAQRGDPRWNY